MGGLFVGTLVGSLLTLGVLRVPMLQSYRASLAHSRTAGPLLREGQDILQRVAPFYPGSAWLQQQYREAVPADTAAAHAPSRAHPAH